MRFCRLCDLGQNALLSVPGFPIGNMQLALTRAGKGCCEGRGSL